MSELKTKFSIGDKVKIVKYGHLIWENKWLIKNCNIQSFRNRILEVYPKNWSGFKGQKWIPKTKEKPK